MKTLLLCFLIAVSRAQEIPDFDWDDPTELDEYVHLDDGYWNWEVIGEERYQYVTVYHLNMTSQRWMAHDEDFASRQTWWHIMGIAVPDEIAWPEHAGLFIGSGNNNADGPPDRGSYWNVVAASIANDTQMIVAYLLQVPNQPILFRDDPKQSSRSEDNYIAYTWRWAYDEYTRDPEDEDLPFEVIARFPMTKAAKRGLDTIAAFAAENVPEAPAIDKFFVMGASKRGWTTWSLAAVDQRVIAIAPLVFSLLKMEETIMHHYQTMGGAWSFAFGPYYNEDLTYHLTEDVVTDLLYKFEDPYRYRTRLSAIPKVMIVASGDEFFFCSDSHQWWDDIQSMGYMAMMMNPNAEHVLFPHWLRIYRTIAAFALTVLNGDDLPAVRSERVNDEDGGTARLVVEGEQPVSVRAMSSVTIDEGERRDWRLVAGHPDREVHPVRWNETDYFESDGTYECRVDNDPEGVEWNACFVEGTWEYGGFPMYLTSEVVMTPDTFPVEPCEGDDCYGYLV